MGIRAARRVLDNPEIVAAGGALGLCLAELLLIDDDATVGALVLKACAVCYAVLLFFLWSMRAKMADGHVAYPLHLSLAAVGVVHAGTAAFAQAAHSLRHDRVLVVLDILLGAGAGAIALGHDSARARVPVDDSDDEDDHLRADNAEGALLRKRHGHRGGYYGAISIDP